MIKLTQEMHFISLNEGYDLWEDEDCIYLTDKKKEVVATFSRLIKSEILKLAAQEIMYRKK